MKKELISLNRKEEICSALKRLMKRKNIQKITIQEIADECGISRYTFYYHFQDIYDCLSWMLQEELRRQFQLLGDDPSWEDAFTLFIENFQENQAIYKHMQNSPRPDHLRNFLHQEIQPIMQLALTKAINAKQYQVTESYVAFLTDLFTATAESMPFFWLEKHLDDSPQLLLSYLHTILDDQFERILQCAEKQGFCSKVEANAAALTETSSESWNRLL